VLKVAEVDTWESLKGEHVRLYMSNLMGPVEAIGHITKNGWFNPGINPRETIKLSDGGD